MIHKNALLAKLKKCLEDEQFVVKLCAQHATDESFFVAMNKENRKTGKDLLCSLQQDSETYRKALNELIRTVEESHQNVF